MESSQNEVKVNRQYYWHILQSEQMLTGIKQETDDNSVFQHCHGIETNPTDCKVKGASTAVSTTL